MGRRHQVRQEQLSSQRRRQKQKDSRGSSKSSSSLKGKSKDTITRPHHIPGEDEDEEALLAELGEEVLKDLLSDMDEDGQEEQDDSKYVHNVKGDSDEEEWASGGFGSSDSEG
jgi:hypothetical protein